jgi:hypothetical protein
LGADLFGLLRLVWTNRGEAKHLQFKRWVTRMNRWNVERDMMHFEELVSVVNTHAPSTPSFTIVCTDVQAPGEW